MKSKHKARLPRNRNLLPEFDLFAWADQRERNQLPRFVRLISRRYGVSPHHALAIADNAGIHREHGL